MSAGEYFGSNCTKRPTEQAIIDWRGAVPKSRRRCRVCVTGHWSASKKSVEASHGGNITRPLLGVDVDVVGVVDVRTRYY